MEADQNLDMKQWRIWMNMQCMERHNQRRGSILYYIVHITEVYKYQITNAILLFIYA